MSSTIYWMLVDASQSLPQPGEVLSTSELAKFASFRFPKRRDEWLLGRWAAKSLAHSLPQYQPFPLDQIEILNSPAGAPYIQVLNGSVPNCSLSLSHSGHMALCALSMIPALHVGADLEKIEARTEAFVLDYFTPAECRLVETFHNETRAEAVTLIWSAKEAMLKALGVGLRQDTRSVEVRALRGIPYETGVDWNKIEAGEPGTDGRIWSVWWQRRGEYVLTLAAFATTQPEIQSVQLIQKQAG